MSARSLLQRGPYSAIVPDTCDVATIPFSPGLHDDLLDWTVNISASTRADAEYGGVSWNTSSNYVYNSVLTMISQGFAVEYRVALARGTWFLDVIHQYSTSNGIMTFELNGDKVAEIDCYIGYTTLNNWISRTSTFLVPYTGVYTFRVSNPTKYAGSPGYTIRFHHIQFRRMVKGV